jgi:hypothetical protein
MLLAHQRIAASNPRSDWFEVAFWFFLATQKERKKKKVGR